MKKKTLLLSVILMFGATMFFSSCSDKVCVCENKDTKGVDQVYDKYEMEVFKVDKCEDLADELEDEYGYEYSCEKRK